MTVRKALFGLAPVLFLGLAPTAADAAVYCNTAGYPAGCVWRAPRVVVAPSAAYVAPRYYAPRTAVNLGGPVNRVGVR